MNPTNKLAYKRHNILYSGPRKSRKQVQAAFKRHHGSSFDLYLRLPPFCLYYEKRLRLGSELWEVWALRRHAAPALAAAAASVFAAADPRAQSVALAPPDLAAHLIQIARKLYKSR